MATGTVTFSAADYPSRSLVTVTKWAGALPIEGATDAFYGVGPEIGDLTLPLDETDGTFCYRFVVETPATLEEIVHFATLAPGVTINFRDLPLVDPYSFAPVDATPTLIETIEQVIADNPPVIDPADIADAVDDYFLANPLVTGYVHTQAVASASWMISHPFGRLPAVTIFVGGEIVEADVTADTTSANVTFSTPYSGVAVLN